MFDFDRELAERYGVFASYQSAAAPSSIEYYGENPSTEVDRLLDYYATPRNCVIEIGCGAGHTLCRLAPRVKQIWGVDSNEELLNAARLRIERLGITNATLIHGSSYDAEAMKSLPDATFDLAFSRRGPKFSENLLRTLHNEAIFVQEVVSNFDGYPMGEIFGRRHYIPSSYTDQEVLLNDYMKIGLVLVSCKEYFYEEFFRDREHLAAFLTQVKPMLSPWLLAEPVSRAGYDPLNDRAALDLYVRYNTASRGVRVLRQRKILVLHRNVEVNLA